MKVLDLFSGIGGFSLGLERAGMETVAFCEIDPFCRQVLNKHWPLVPIHEDIRSLDAKQYRGIDVVCGGWPCQTHSTAARGRNNHPDMWPDFLRIVRNAAPRWIIGENVLGIGDRGVDRVCSDLEDAGYFSQAVQVDAAHRSHARSRIFFVAHAHSESKSMGALYAQMAKLRASSRRIPCARPTPLGVANGLPRRVDRLRALGNSVMPEFVEVIGRAVMA